MPALTTDILAWIKDGFRDGVPDGEAPALYAVLTDRIGTNRGVSQKQMALTEVVPHIVANFHVALGVTQ